MREGVDTPVYRGCCTEGVDTPVTTPPDTQVDTPLTTPPQTQGRRPVCTGGVVRGVGDPWLQGVLYRGVADPCG